MLFAGALSCRSALLDPSGPFWSWRLGFLVGCRASCDLRPWASALGLRVALPGAGPGRPVRPGRLWLVAGALAYWSASWLPSRPWVDPGSILPGPFPGPLCLRVHGLRIALSVPFDPLPWMVSRFLGAYMVLRPRSSIPWPWLFQIGPGSILSPSALLALSRKSRVWLDRVYLCSCCLSTLRPRAAGRRPGDLAGLSLPALAFWLARLSCRRRPSACGRSAVLPYPPSR